LFDLDLFMLRRAVDGQRTGFISGCDECGLVFSNPLPSDEELAQFYSPAGEWGAPRAAPVTEAQEAVEQRGKSRSWTRMFEPILDVVDVTAPPSGARVLDFGCGDGALLNHLRDCGWDTWGIEPAVDHAFRRHNRLREIPDEPMFDLVIANHVLEHVTNPLALLQQFAAACRLGGHLVVSVPRLDTLPVHRDYKYVINGRAHVMAYTWACLKGLLARAGWEPVATPPDRISKGGGRQTVARLRVVARRVDGPLAMPAAPADEARAAVRGYHSEVASRPRLERLGLWRLAARQAEARWRRETAARKATRVEIEER
jgi:SAM-dependent methyltransferase